MLASSVSCLWQSNVEASTETQWVLGPDAEAALSRMLNQDEPFHGEQELRASIIYSKIEVQLGPADAPILAVSLLHPSAPYVGERVEVCGVLLVPIPGPAPAELITNLTERIRSNCVELPWRPTESNTEDSPEYATDDGQVSGVADSLVPETEESPPPDRWGQVWSQWDEWRRTLPPGGFAPDPRTAWIAAIAGGLLGLLLVLYLRPSRP